MFIHKSLKQTHMFISLIHTKRLDLSHNFRSNLIQPSITFTQTRQKSSKARRPKKRIYHRDQELDNVMDLSKKPSLVFKLKSIIQSQENGTLLLRDLEKEVGFVQKWNFMSIIERYPLIFNVGSTSRNLPFVSLSDKAEKIASEEVEFRKLMEPILVKNLRKLLMLCVDCRVSLEKIEFVSNEIGLPEDFRSSIIDKYTECFCVKSFNGKDYLHLETWDSDLAVTAREERLANEGVPESNPSRRVARIEKDGNFFGPFAFKMRFAAGFRPNASFLEELEKWQRLEFPSPYLNARRFDIGDPKSRKRVVGVLHEFLSLTMEKRTTSAQLDAFHSEILLPSRLLLWLVKQHGIFYMTNKGVRSTVILKDAYEGSRLIDKWPLRAFSDKFMALAGRTESNARDKMPSSQFFT